MHEEKIIIWGHHHRRRRLVIMPAVRWSIELINKYPIHTNLMWKSLKKKSTAESSS